MSSLPKIYLFVYNALQAFGWSIVLFRILSNLISTHSVNGALCIRRSAYSFFASCCLLGSDTWSSWGRTHFVFIVRNVVEVRELPSVFITFFAWSLSEVIRYLHYAVNSIGIRPPLITYFKYTAFIILYPAGVAAVLIMYQALPFIKEMNLYDGFFAALPFCYHDFLRVLFVCYHSLPAFVKAAAVKAGKKIPREEE